MRHPRTCVYKWRPTASTLCHRLYIIYGSAHSVFPARKCKRYYAQSKAQKAHLQRISWILVAVSSATRIALRRYRLFEERRRWLNNSDFWPFQVCHFKIVSYYALLVLLQTGAGSISCSMYFQTQAFVPLLWYRRENANTMIGTAILKSGHPYIWARDIYIIAFYENSGMSTLKCWGDMILYGDVDIEN